MSHALVEMTLALFVFFAAFDARGLPAFLRAALMAASAIVLLAIGARYAHAEPLFDFTAFYCGGHAVLHHLNPYLATSLRACETAGLSASPAVIPAPQPGYDLALFALFAVMPFADANAAWIVLLCAALVTAVLALHRLTGLGTVCIFASIALPIAYISFDLGQLAPIVLALLCACALAIREGRATMAGTLAAITLIEPHVGLAVVLIVAIILPRARMSIVVTGACLAAISLAVLGIGVNVAYFAHELPLHALAESGNSEQYSFSMLVHWLGANDALADRLGMLQYLVMLAAGLTIGTIASRRTGNRAMGVVTAVSAVLLGGTFIHISEIALAIPAALLLASRCSGPTRDFGIAALVCLALIWNSQSFGQLFVASAVVLALTLWGILRDLAPRLRGVTIAAVFLAYFTLMHAAELLPDHSVRLAGDRSTYERAVANETVYASAEWGSFMHRDPEHSTSSVRILVKKLPSWFALVFILCGAYRCAFPVSAEGRKRPMARDLSTDTS